MSANWTQTWSKITNGTKAIEDQRRNIASTFLTQLSTIIDLTPALESPNQAAFLAGFQAVRGSFAAAVSSPAWQVVWSANLLQLGQIISTLVASVQTPSTDINTIIDSLTEYMMDAGYRIETRDITRGAWTPVPAYTPNFNGDVVRLTVDRWGNPLESGFADVVSFVCQLDAQSGTNFGQEVFSVVGRRFLDILTALDTTFGSGLSASMTGVTGDTTQALILNPSFSDSSGTGASFQLTNWDQTFSGGATAAQLSTDTTNYYRPCAIESTPASLKMTAGGSAIFTQTLASRRGALTPNTPYFSQLAINNVIGAGAGSVTVSIGSKTWLYTFTGLETDWVLLRPTIDEDLYFENFNETDLEVVITVQCSAGYILIDDFLWAPMTPFDGVLYSVVGGDVTFLVDDAGSFTDTEPRQSSPSTAPGKVQWGLAVAFGRSLPSTMPAPTTAPTVALAGAGAGNVNNGAHTYVVTYVGANGTESPQSSGNAVTVVNNAADGRVAVSAIPVGPAGTASRRIYRSKAATTTPLYLLTTIADNVTVVYQDNIADASLPSTVPPSVTMISDPA